MNLEDKGATHGTRLCPNLRRNQYSISTSQMLL